MGNTAGVDKKYLPKVVAELESKLTEGESHVTWLYDMAVTALMTQHMVSDKTYDEVSKSCAMLNVTYADTHYVATFNGLVEDDKYSLPNIQQIMESTQGKKYFTVIDLKYGYFQMKLEKEDRYKTAFYFENRLYQWKRMPQGYNNAPAIFQRTMDNLLEECIGKCCSIYLDDIVIYGISEDEYD